MKVCFEVPGKPKGKARPRFSQYSKCAYTPKETVEAERYIRECFYKHMMNIDAEFTPTEKPVKLMVNAFFKPLAKFKKFEKESALNGSLLPTCKPDADNIIKLVMDSLNRYAYKDDSQIHIIYCSKHYSGLEATFITMEWED